MYLIGVTLRVRFRVQFYIELRLLYDSYVYAEAWLCGKTDEKLLNATEVPQKSRKQVVQWTENYFIQQKNPREIVGMAKNGQQYNLGDIGTMLCGMFVMVAQPA